MAITIAGILILMLIIAKSWPKQPEPLAESHPLDIDANIPFPEAGQGSSIFSLTALFGPYLVLFLYFGLPSTMALGIGTILGLFLIQREVKQYSTISFQLFIQNKFVTPSGQKSLFLVCISSRADWFSHK